MKGFVLTAVALLVAAPTTLYAQDTAALRKVDVSVRLGYVVFSEGVKEDDGIYLSLAAYRRVADRVYLGAEAGGAATVSIFTDEMSLAPLEVNVKYARAVGSSFVLVGGGGLSYARAVFHQEVALGPDMKYHDWLFGGQVFADCVLGIKWFALGVNAKYQLMQDFTQVPADFSNLRLGLQVGVLF